MTLLDTTVAPIETTVAATVAWARGRLPLPAVALEEKSGKPARAMLEAGGRRMV